MAVFQDKRNLTSWEEEGWRVVWVLVLGVRLVNVEDSGEALSDAKHGLMSTIALGGSPVLLIYLQCMGCMNYSSHGRHTLTHQLPQNRSQPAERSDSQAQPRKPHRALGCSNEMLRAVTLRSVPIRNPRAVAPSDAGDGEGMKS